MKITPQYLEELTAVIKALKQIDLASGVLYTVGPVIIRDGEDEGCQEFHIEWDADGYWYLDTDKSKDIE